MQNTLSSAIGMVRSGALASSQIASDFLKTIPKKEMQRGLLVVTTATAILATIPPLRLAGSLALRSIAFLSSGVNSAGNWEREGIFGRALGCAKIAVVAVGAIGVVAASPTLIVASVAADIAVQTFELGKAIYNEDPDRALCSLGVIVVDSFVLAAVATGAWPFLVTAAAISAFVMAGLAIKAGATSCLNDDPWMAVDSLCYAALATLGIVNAAMIPSYYRDVPLTWRYNIRNRSDYSVEVYNKHGSVVARVAPRDAAYVKIDVKDSIDGEYAKLIYVGSDGIAADVRYLRPWNAAVFRTELSSPALAPKEFPKVPVGGTSIVTADFS